MRAIGRLEDFAANLALVSWIVAPGVAALLAGQFLISTSPDLVRPDGRPCGAPAPRTRMVLAPDDAASDHGAGGRHGLRAAIDAVAGVRTPRAPATDDRGLVQPDDGQGQRVPEKSGALIRGSNASFVGLSDTCPVALDRLFGSEPKLSADEKSCPSLRPGAHVEY